VRPLRLSIEGLTVFRSPQEIDFGDLDLFVITGPTGAGKTSILDAITLALYGDVCRVKSGELRELISHGATHVKVALDFRVDGTTYRVARRLKKVGQGHDVRFVRLDGDSETPVTDESRIKAVNGSIERVLGLDFSSFTKAVLLPQGAFQEFLKGDANARRQILIRLLDLDRYLRVGAKARDKAKLLEAQTRAQQDVLESEYGDATADALKAAKGEEKNAKAAYEELRAVEEKTRDLIAAAADAQTVASHAAGAVRTFGELENEVAEYVAQATPLAEMLEQRKAHVAASNVGILDAKKQLGSAGTTLERLVSKLGDEAAIATLQSASQTRQSEMETLARMEAEIGSAGEALAEAEITQKGAGKAAKEAGISLQRVQRECEGAKAQLEHALASEEVQKTHAALESATKARDAAVVELDGAREHLAHLEASDLAVTLRQGLKRGDLCPVCESTITTLPKTPRAASSVLKNAKDALAKAEQNRVGAEQAFSNAETLHGAAGARLQQSAADLPAKAELLPVPKAEQLLRKQEQALTVAEEAKAGADATLSESTITLETQKTHLKGLEKQAADATARLEPAETVLRSAFARKLPDDLDNQLVARLQQVKDAREEHTTAARRVAEAERAGAEAAAAQRQTEDELAGVAGQFAQTRTRAEVCVEALERAANVSLSAVPPVKGTLVTQLSETADALRAYAGAAQETEAEANKAHGKSMRDLTKLLTPLELPLPDSTEDLARVMQEAVQEAHTNAAAAKKAADLLKDRLKRRKELEAEIADSSIRCARYKALGQELHRDNFIAFVLAESMERLAALASVELLRISDDRYSLVAESDGFDVTDHQNADERRSVATLSGGETFLASLALALALAGSVRDIGGSAAAARLDAIFIDEGFGALDPETLEVVLDALERLREGERMVGVISHVGELAQRIPQGLTVTKNGSISTISVR
jgi:DNA repair protein SbcC/Rad50